MVQSKVAIRYAKSFLELAIEKDSMGSAQEDMTVVAQAYDDSRELQLLLHSPIIKVDKKLSVLKEIFTDNISAVSMAFIGIITKKGRESLLGQIAHAFIIMAKERKNIFAAQVVSAIALDDSLRERVLEIIAEVKPGGIELNEVVDPKIIGGFVLRIGDQMVDASVSTKIRELQREFSVNPHISQL